jgi:hypothetical protein
MTIRDPDELESEVEIFFCGGNTGPDDLHLASTVHCVDDEIFEWLGHHEKQIAIAAEVIGETARTVLLFAGRRCV